MIITPQFVFVHCQKTGGTFVSEVLRDLLCPNQHLRILYNLFRKYGLKLPFFKYRFREYWTKDEGQHSWCNDIPHEDRNKKIISILRDPYEFYVSAYTFGWWKNDLLGCLKNERFNYFENKNALRKKYPNLTHSNFGEFLEASWEFSRWSKMAVDLHPNAKNLGMCTQRHVFFFCRNHSYVLEAAGDHDVFLKRLRDEHYDVQFLRQENLNSDLFAFLLSVGYSKSDLEFVLRKREVNVSRKNRDIRKFYDKSLKEKIRKADSPLFELFPDYDK